MALSKLIFGAVLSLGLVTLSAGLASAQYTYYPPYYPGIPQPLVLPNPGLGGVTVIHPSALSPGASMAIPGTGQFWQDPFSGASGFTYLGIDGQPHGNTVFFNPLTGVPEQHFYDSGPAE